MTPTSRFDPRSPADDARLVDAHPFAWVVSTDGGALHATPLPLRARCDETGRVTRFEGHFARSNPHFQALQRQPVAHLLFLGPHGYVSPSWMHDRTQAPTWNYAVADCRVRIRFDEDPAVLRRAIETLVDAHEAGRPNRWSVADMGARYDLLAMRIVAFEAEVLEMRSRYKLGQDERPDVLADILAGLERGAAETQTTDDGRLLAWMRDFNGSRVDR